MLYKVQSVKSGQPTAPRECRWVVLPITPEGTVPYWLQGEHQGLQECTAYFLYLTLTLRTTRQWIPTVLVKYPYHDPENPARSSLSLPLQSSFHSPF